MSFRLPYCDDLAGVPFRWFGRDPAKALDCNGVVLEVYRRAGVRLPDPCAPETPDDAFDGVLRRVESPPWRPGDILMFGKTALMKAGARLSAHAGVYLGAGVLLHSTIEMGSRIDALPLDDYTVLFAHRLCDDTDG